MTPGIELATLVKSPGFFFFGVRSSQAHPQPPSERSRNPSPHSFPKVFADILRSCVFDALLPSTMRTLSELAFNNPVLPDRHNVPKPLIERSPIPSDPPFFFFASPDRMLRSQSSCPVSDLRHHPSGKHRRLEVTLSLNAAWLPLLAEIHSLEPINRSATPMLYISPSLFFVRPYSNFFFKLALPFEETPRKEFRHRRSA